MTRTDFYSLHDPKHAQWILMTEQVSCFRTTVVQATPLMETVQLITPSKISICKRCGLSKSKKRNA